MSNLKPEDCEITVYRAGTATEMRIVHYPTGTFIEGRTRRSQHRLREELLEKLSEKIRESKQRHET